MELFGRLTGDAKVLTLKNDRQVVNFSIAINDSYKAKRNEEVTKVVTYVQCGYWINSGIAKYLTKGHLVEIQGRVGVNAYTGTNGEAKATLTFHVNTIKIHGKTGAKNKVSVKENPATILAPAEDLPF